MLYILSCHSYSLIMFIVFIYLVYTTLLIITNHYKYNAKINILPIYILPSVYYKYSNIILVTNNVIYQ